MYCGTLMFYNNFAVWISNTYRTKSSIYSKQILYAVCSTENVSMHLQC